MRVRLRSAAFSLVLWGAFASGSAAGGPPPPPLAQSLTGSARAAYNGGRQLYDAQDFAGAATKFRAAYRESEDARLLWNIATCEKGLRHYARTAALIEEFIAKAAGSVPPDFIAQAEATLAALREFYSPLSLTAAPPGTRVLIDGEETGVAPFTKPIPVDLGKHTVRAEHDGFTPQERVLDVAGREPVTLDFALVALPTVAEVVISSADAHDVISLDERVVGNGRWQGSVEAGLHHVTVTASGKKPYAKDIDVAAGRGMTLEVTLENEHRPTVWPWIAGGAAFVAGAVVGGYFLLRPGSSLAPPSAGPSAMTVQLSSGHGWSLR
jgi:hypothetical protein